MGLLYWPERIAFLNSRGDGDGKDGVNIIISEVDGASPQELIVLKV